MKLSYSKNAPFPSAVLTIILLTAAALLIYHNILDAPFMFDDLPNIVTSPHIRMSELTLDKIINGTRGPSPFRPVAYLSFSINYFLGRYNVFGYHLVNIAVLITTAFLIFLITGHTLRLTGIKRGAIPELAALVWLVNPLHTQSITYTVQRINSLATLFFLLSLYCYIRARLAQDITNDKRLKTLLLFSGCFVSGLLALFSKEIAATLPVMIILYEWFFFRTPGKIWTQKPGRWFILAVIIILPIVVLSLKASPVQRILGSYDNQSFTLGQRLLTEPGVVVYYLSLLLFPHPARLNVDYDFPLSTSLFDPLVTTLALAAIAALLIAAVYKPGRNRLQSFALLWFLGNLVIESSFIGVAIIFEHRTYLPSIFPIFVLVTLIVKHTPRPVAAVAICLALIACMSWTYQRNIVWKDTLSLWQDCARKSPRKARPANGVGMAYQTHQKPEQALAWFQKAVRLDPDYDEALNNIGVILVNLGRAAEALPYLERAVTLAPESHKALTSFGTALKQLGRLEDAAVYYRKALSLYPEFETAHNNYGALLTEKGAIDSAIRHLNRAIEINPDYHEAYSNLGLAMMQQGKAKDAISFYRQSIELNPEYATAHFNMGTACFQVNDLDCARQHLALAARFATNPVLALNNLTAVLVMQKKYGQAVDTLMRLTELLPKSSTVYYNLACVYALAGEKKASIKALARAVDLGYDRWENMTNDPDLENIRDTDYYNRLVRLNKDEG